MHREVGGMSKERVPLLLFIGGRERKSRVVGGPLAFSILLFFANQWINS